MNNPFTATVPKLESITEKYAFISTAQFIADVESFGYKLETTTSPRRGLGMHSMSFSHPALPKADGLSMRLLATNSHDGTSAFRLYVQVLVQVCSNGLVAWRSKVDTRVVHRGYALDKVESALVSVRAQFDHVLKDVQRLQNTSVTPEQAANFLLEAVKLRDAKPYRIIDLQATRFQEQAVNSAWNIFNRVQDSLIRGGYKTLSTETTETGAVITFPGAKARELTNIKERVAINRKLWELAINNLIERKAA